MAADAHDQLRKLGLRHLYPWFEQHEEVLARGLAAELALALPHRAVYHVLGAPGIAIAMVKRRQLTIPETPQDLWIRAAEPERERDD